MGNSMIAFLNYSILCGCECFSMWQGFVIAPWHIAYTLHPCFFSSVQPLRCHCTLIKCLLCLKQKLKSKLGHIPVVHLMSDTVVISSLAYLSLFSVGQMDSIQLWPVQSLITDCQCECICQELICGLWLQQISSIQKCSTPFIFQMQKCTE